MIINCPQLLSWIESPLNTSSLVTHHEWRPVRRRDRPSRQWCRPECWRRKGSASEGTCTTTSTGWRGTRAAPGYYSPPTGIPCRVAGRTLPTPEENNTIKTFLKRVTQTLDHWKKHSSHKAHGKLCSNMLYTILYRTPTITPNRNQANEVKVENLVPVNAVNHLQLLQRPALLLFVDILFSLLYLL